MKLRELLKDIEVIKIVGGSNVEISSLCFDSRKVEKGSAFFAVSGSANDGHLFISDVIEKGALAIICEKLPKIIKEGVCYVQLKNSSEALGLAANVFFKRPSEKLKVIGVTGTNGKTSIVSLLYDVFKQMGYKCGLISTVKVLIGDELIPATHTTPDALRLNEYFKQMLDSGCLYCFIEVSSHALVQSRVAGVHFAGAVFTNLTHDHLDFHHTLSAYRDAKKMLFDMLPKTAFALTNIDDKNGTFMLQNTKAKKVTYSLTRMADYRAKIIENTFSGLELNINGTGLWTRLVGCFNAYNTLCVYAVAELLGMEKQDILIHLSSIGGVKGRFEHFTSESGVQCIVDYAHTPDALQNVIDTVNAVRTKKEEFILVFGCGGDRDALKRPIMAKIAANGADKIIITSDNPRGEDPQEIIKQILAGVPATENRKVLSINDRREAIRAACMLTKKGDIILLAGKGHETYQEIKGIRSHFDDMEELKNFFNN